MPMRQGHYYIYDPQDVHGESIVVEILGYGDRYREHAVPLLYLCRNCEDVAQTMEEITLYQEKAHGVKKMERVSEYFFQVQRLRLVSLEPLNSARKWGTFSRIVEAYNLGETGECCMLDDYLERKGPTMLETVRGAKGLGDIGKLRLPENGKLVADLINRYNQHAIKQEW